MKHIELKITYRDTSSRYTVWYIIETVTVNVLPGVFNFHEAIEIQELVSNEYQIPSLEKGNLICKALNKIGIFTDSCITSDFKEFGEDGNWIYIANYNQHRACTGNSSKIKPVRDGRFRVLLYKSISKEFKLPR